MISPSVPIGNSTVPLNFSTAQKSRKSECVQEVDKWPMFSFALCLNLPSRAHIGYWGLFIVDVRQGFFGNAWFFFHCDSPSSRPPHIFLLHDGVLENVTQARSKGGPLCCTLLVLPLVFLWLDEKKVRQRQWDLFWESSKCRAWRTQGRIRVNSKVHKDQQIFYSISWWIQT